MNRLSVVLVLALVAHTALAQPSDTAVPVRKSRVLLVPAAMVNDTASAQYAQMKQQAAARRVLNTNPESLARVRNIAARLIPHGTRFNRDTASWKWEVNLIDAPMVNAFCMPGGKIMVFSGIINKLKLSDDELAAIIGHEIAHALLEHGRARMSEQVLKNVGVNLAAA
ncbi:MAG: M48 family metallopeptidase, partial [Burkholderiales bacterium]